VPIGIYCRVRCRAWNGRLRESRGSRSLASWPIRDRVGGARSIIESAAARIEPRALGRLTAQKLMEAGAGPLLEAARARDFAVSSLALAGRRVLVTRALHQAGKLSEGLRALGAEPVEVPVLEIRPPASFEALDAALRQIDSYDWLILTSANAVRALDERAAELGDCAGAECTG
jgi:hypothetical protein